MLVNLTGASFPIEANISGADVRFMDADGAELAYWIESWDYANRSARVWVNVTNLPTSVSSMRMWYGNPNATSSSNGDATFEFFDDYEGTSLNLTKWDVKAGANYLLSNGVIKIAGNSWGYYALDFGVPAIFSKLGFNDYILQANHDTDNINATFEPTYYANSSIPVSTIGKAVAWQEIELLKKQTGNITGSVTR